ncbi:MAG: TIGR00730 family Rossman fold protein [Roseiarcus sp.]
MTIVRNICVYCGSSMGNDPRFGEAADQLGSEIAAAGIRLVFGGGDAGLMGRVARSVLASGGRVTGIIPKFLIKHENALLSAQELIVVDDMHQRKQMMFDRSDAFVALPGGIGTLEELVEQLTWVQLARHRKPVLLADIGGFWRPLLALIAHMHNLGFLREGFDVHYLVAETIEDVLPMLSKAASRVAPAV